MVFFFFFLAIVLYAACYFSSLYIFCCTSASNPEMIGPIQLSSPKPMRHPRDLPIQASASNRCKDTLVLDKSRPSSETIDANPKAVQEIQTGQKNASIVSSKARAHLLVGIAKMYESFIKSFKSMSLSNGENFQH